MIESKSMIFVDFIFLVKQYPKDFPTQRKNNTNSYNKTDPKPSGLNLR